MSTTVKYKTVVIEVNRWCGGVLAGDYGMPGYRVVQTPPSNFTWGLDLEEIVGPLWTGALVEVKMRVLKQGKKQNNPWRNKRRGKA